MFLHPFNVFKQTFLKRSPYPSAEDRCTKRRWMAAWLSKGNALSEEISQMISEKENWRGSAFCCRFSPDLAKSALNPSSFLMGFESQARLWRWRSRDLMSLGLTVFILEDVPICGFWMISFDPHRMRLMRLYICKISVCQVVEKGNMVRVED